MQNVYVCVIQWESLPWRIGRASYGLTPSLSHPITVSCCANRVCYRDRGIKYMGLDDHLGIRSMGVRVSALAIRSIGIEVWTISDTRHSSSVTDSILRHLLQWHSTDFIGTPLTALVHRWLHRHAINATGTSLTPMVRHWLGWYADDSIATSLTPTVRHCRRWKCLSDSSFTKVHIWPPTIT